MLVALHRLLAWASFHSEWMGKLVKGEALLLAEQGRPIPEHLSQAYLSQKDLLDGLHTNANLAHLDQTEAVYLERDGSISVVKKEQQQ
ncbi:YetF domain-containing protein [Hymenobacter sp. BRD67]|uniref:YetF domain-containing protein n=1 Tax=Hymenobacter sp. BRD67 TaxID=2675877 RepID=UPI00156724BF|nr:YetF domain-containing protein [Hymenobacter sp. BRD67]QKG54039.1 DUF421 domain-containing protein [Hymenobacter sp. BRD67]